MKSLEPDLKSIAASGWGPEFIPEDEILQSQFPEVLAQIANDHTRIAELDALLTAANVAGEEDGEESDSEGDDDNSGEEGIGVLPKAKVKALKDAKKALNSEIRQLKKEVRELKKSAKDLLQAQPVSCGVRV